MNISPMNPNETIPCGLCKKAIPATKLKTPVPISIWDKKHNYVREYVHNCCGQNWLYGDSLYLTKTESQGAEIIQ